MIRKSKPLQNTTNTYESKHLVDKDKRLSGSTHEKFHKVNPNPILNQGNSISLKDFDVGKKLGKGKLGKVYCVRHIKSNFICALKVMNIPDLVNLKLEKNLRREIEIQSLIKHENICQLYGYFHDSNKIYLILEFSVYGELYHHLKLKRRFDDSLASYYVFQLTNSLIYLHENHIVHRDIKPENILLDFNHQIKLSDFGWSINLSKTPNGKRYTMCGTLDYLPPEMINSVNHDFHVDVWSLGILIYEFLVGKPPFEHYDKNVTYKKISRIDLVIPSFVNPDAKDLIVKLLQKNPNDRLPLSKVLSHPWIVNQKKHWPVVKDAIEPRT